MSQIDKIINRQKNNLNNITLLYSSEDYLLEKYSQRFVNEFVSEEVKDFNLTFLDDDDQEFVKKLKTKSLTLPTFSEKRFIIADCSNYFLKKSKKDNILIDLFTSFPHKTIIILLIKGKIDKRIKVNKTIKKQGELIELKSPKYRNLDRWIRNKFNEKGKSIANNGIKLLEEMFDNNLRILENEIEKIILCFQESDNINANDIKKIISRDKSLKENIIFSFTDALSNRNKEKAVNLLNDMIKDGESSLMILKMIARQLRLLIQVKELKKKGYKPDKIASLLQEHPYPIKKCYSQGENFSLQKLELLLERFLEANIDIVSGKYKNDKVALEMALLNI